MAILYMQLRLFRLKAALVLKAAPSILGMTSGWKIFKENLTQSFRFSEI